MYIVMSNWGMRKICWTMRTAMEWLACVKEEGMIVGRWSKRIYARRIAG